MIKGRAAWKLHGWWPKAGLNPVGGNGAPPPASLCSLALPIGATELRDDIIAVCSGQVALCSWKIIRRNTGYGGSVQYFFFSSSPAEFMAEVTFKHLMPWFTVHALGSRSFGGYELLCFKHRALYCSTKTGPLSLASSCSHKWAAAQWFPNSPSAPLSWCQRHVVAWEGESRSSFRGREGVEFWGMSVKSVPSPSFPGCHILFLSLAALAQGDS